jgi:hypothetical protein
MRRFVLALALLTVVARAAAADLPPNAKLYLPVLQAEIQRGWPDVKPGSMLAAMVDRETCASPKSPRCWSPRAELKTAREYGFGFPQLTITSRFNAFDEVKRLDTSLAGWSYADRYNPQFQMRALVALNRFNYNRLAMVPDNWQRMAMTASAHNGGLGGVFADMRKCKASSPRCNPVVWVGHVELNSGKSRTAFAGYGESPYAINRGYVREVLGTRRTKYIRPMGEL